MSRGLGDWQAPIAKEFERLQGLLRFEHLTTTGELDGKHGPMVMLYVEVGNVVQGLRYGLIDIDYLDRLDELRGRLISVV